MVDVVELGAGDWRSGPVLVARSFAERLRGLRPDPVGKAMAIPGCSITTCGMRRPLAWMALDPASAVIASGVIRAGRFVWIRGASMIVEFEADRRLPPVGTLVSIVAWCPED